MHKHKQTIIGLITIMAAINVLVASTVFAQIVQNQQNQQVEMQINRGCVCLIHVPANVEFPKIILMTNASGDQTGPDTNGVVGGTVGGAANLIYPPTDAAHRIEVFDQGNGDTFELDATLANLVSSLGNVTISVGSPAVVILPNHGLAAGDSFYFTTTPGGILPTEIDNNLPTDSDHPLDVNKPYYVIPDGLDANNFEFSDTHGGLAVSTSGFQYGTHSVVRTIGYDNVGILSVVQSDTNSVDVSQPNNPVGPNNITAPANQPLAKTTNSLQAGDFTQFPLDNTDTAHSAPGHEGLPVVLMQRTVAAPNSIGHYSIGLGFHVNIPPGTPAKTFSSQLTFTFTTPIP